MSSFFNKRTLGNRGGALPEAPSAIVLVLAREASGDAFAIGRDSVPSSRMRAAHPSLPVAGCGRTKHHTSIGRQLP